MDSMQNAAMLRDELIDLTIDLCNYPTKYPPDKFKKDNDGTWRAFEKYHYRISYRNYAKRNPYRALTAYQQIAS